MFAHRGFAVGVLLSFVASVPTYGTEVPMDDHGVYGPVLACMEKGTLLRILKVAERNYAAAVAAIPTHECFAYYMHDTAATVTEWSPVDIPEIEVAYGVRVEHPIIERVTFSCGQSIEISIDFTLDEDLIDPDDGVVRLNEATPEMMCGSGEAVVG